MRGWEEPGSTEMRLEWGDWPGDDVCSCSVTVITCCPACPARHMIELWMTVDEVQLAGVKR